MNEVCIPIPHFGEDQIAEVSVTIDKKQYDFKFRVEAFPWDIENGLKDLSDQVGDAELRIKSLRKRIEKYNDGWDLVQIFTPRTGAKFIQVLFRKRFQHEQQNPPQD